MNTLLFYLSEINSEVVFFHLYTPIVIYTTPNMQNTYPSGDNRYDMMIPIAAQIMPNMKKNNFFLFLFKIAGIIPNRVMESTGKKSPYMLFLPNGSSGINSSGMNSSCIIFSGSGCEVVIVPFRTAATA